MRWGHLRDDDHINNDYRLIGPDGSWQASNGAKPITAELIASHPEALFGAKITTEDNLDVYQDYFDIYNTMISEAEEEKEKTFIDPALILDSLRKAKENRQD